MEDPVGLRRGRLEEEIDNAVRDGLTMHERVVLLLIDEWLRKGELNIRGDLRGRRERPGAVISKSNGRPARVLVAVDKIP